MEEIKNIQKSQKSEKVIVVIPAYNENQTIKKVVLGLFREGVHEVIVVDDGSQDDTAIQAQEAGAIVVKQKLNQGYDAAVNKGFSKAFEKGATIILTFDADDQHNPSDVHKILHPILEDKADIVVGIRSFKQRMMEHLFAAYGRLKIGIRDPLSGAKGYRVEAYKEVGYFDKIGSTGTQLIFAAHKKGFRIVELPIDVFKREGSSRYGRSLVGNYKLLKSFIKIVFMTS